MEFQSLAAKYIKQVLSGRCENIKSGMFNGWIGNGAGPGWID